MLRTWSVGIHKSHGPNIISTYNLSEIKLDAPVEICNPKKQAISQIIIQKSIVLIVLFPYTIVKRLV